MTDLRRQLNNQRLGQTGSGHFTPLTGFHREQNKGLLLDVARFKYPSHWVDLPIIYESMRNLDSQSNLPRGFIIVSRSTEIFSDLCRISQDFELMAEFSKFFEQDSQKVILENALAAQGDEQCMRFLDYLMKLPPKFHDLITLFVIQLTYSLETKRNDIGTSLLQEMENVSKKCPAFLHADYSRFDMNKYPLLNLFKDYLPNDYRKALCLLSAIFYEELSDKSSIKSSQPIQSCSSYIFL